MFYNNLLVGNGSLTGLLQTVQQKAKVSCHTNTNLNTDLQRIQVKLFKASLVSFPFVHWWVYLVTKVARNFVHDKPKWILLNENVSSKFAEQSQY